MRNYVSGLDNPNLPYQNPTDRPFGEPFSVRGLSMLERGQGVLGLERTYAAQHAQAAQSFAVSAAHFQAMRDNFSR